MLGGHVTNLRGSGTFLLKLHTRFFMPELVGGLSAYFHELEQEGT